MKRETEKERGERGRGKEREEGREGERYVGLYQVE